MDKTDRRVQRTRRMIYSALTELLLEKEINHITVQELADRADIHRVTFYSHYADIYELYDEYLSFLMTEVQNMLAPDPTHSYEGFYIAMTDFLDEHRDVAALFYGNSVQLPLLEELVRLMEEKYLEIWLYESGLKTVTEEMRYLTAYNVNGSNGILSKWARQGFAESKEKIIQYLKAANDAFDHIDQYMSGA